VTQLLVGSKKGLFVLDGEPGSTFRIVARRFEGDVVEYATRDRRTGRYFASVTSGFFGPRVMFADDPLGEWRPSAGPAFPTDGDSAVERVWRIEPGESDAVLFAGVDSAALFTSTDGGESWSLNEPLWKERMAGDWQPGFGGLALHSICPWPGDPSRVAIGVSAAGVWITEDGGQSWRTGYAGLYPRYLPEEMRENTNALCVHNMLRASRRPERLFMQFHGSVYRSDDQGASWSDISAGLPCGFGFPIVVDPADPDSAFVIPLAADADRVMPEARARVYETRDAGDTWTARGEGLPGRDAYLTVLRQAFGGSGEGDSLEMYFGATSGEVFGSGDAGQNWFEVARRLAPVTSVRVA